MLGLITAYVTVLLGGGGLAFALLAQKGRSVNLIECLCLAWFFGVGVVSLLLWIGSSVCSDAVLQLAVMALAVAIAFGGWQVTRRSQARFHMPRPATIFEWLLVTVLIAQVATIFYASAKHTLGWDGLLVWEIKARYAFLNHGVLPAAYLSDADRVFSHPDYPLGIPLVQMWTYLWMGEANQFLAKLVFPVFYAAGAMLLAILGSRLTRNRIIGLALPLLLFFVPQVTIGTGGALVGYADVPLALCYMATIGYLLCALRAGLPDSFAIYAACLALLPWIKKEGAILWLVAALAGGAVILMQRRSVRSWCLLLPGLIVMVAWKMFLHFNAAVSSQDFVAISATTLRANFARLVPIGASVLAEMTTMSNWGIFWAVVAIAVFRVLTRRDELVSSQITGTRQARPSAILVGAVFLPIILYASTYVFSAWPSYIDHVNASLPRLLEHVVPVAFLVIGLAVAERNPAIDAPVDQTVPTAIENRPSTAGLA